uniref:Aryl-alcohol oxidase-like protein n=1 Tax=Mycena chlorophos TaxID=658473 RepID=A0ABQ0LKL9_MYCCL|nr:aryl-alcohol oxidase-like protein [Mycena chlorophos]
MASVHVLVIEAGLLDNGTDSDLLHIPLLAGQAAGTIYDWNYTTSAQVISPKFDLPQLTVLDNLVYLRGPSDDFDRFAAFSGDQGWAWQNIQKYIFKSEQHVPPWNNRCNLGEYNPAFHGDGPIQTSLTAMPSELDQHVLKAAQEHVDRFAFNLDLNSGNGLGIGWIETTVGHAARSSASTAFLDPALTRNNLDLLIGTHVQRLVPEKTGGLDFRQVEVSQSAEAKTFTFTATSEVILSAGSIGTPQILQLSGIGPADVLETAHVKQLVNLPAVGANLQDQPIFFLHWAVNSSTLTDFLNDPTAIAAALDEYATNKTGIAASSVIFNTIAFLRLPENSPLLKGSDPAAGPNSPHYQYSFCNAFLGNPGQTSPTTGDFISVSILVQSPTSSFVHPIIDPAYYTTNFDIGTVVEAVHQLQTFFSSPVWNGYLGEPFADTAALTDDTRIEEYARQFATTVKHPVSSCRVSSSDIDGVVGPDLFVHKIQGVRVMDASILPFATAGFPQAQLYILAERAAALIKEKFETCAVSN